MKEAPLSPAPLQRRAAAKAIDLGLAVGVGLLGQQLTPYGALLAAPALLLSDLIGGASIGKRAMALRVAVQGGAARPSGVALVLRNLPLALAAPLAFLPFLGWALSLVAASVLLALEGILAALKHSRRVGDRLARTHVIEADPDADSDSHTPLTRPDL